MGRGRDLRNEVQVVGRRDDRHVTEVHRELRELGLHIDVGSVPAQQRLDRKGMPKIVHPWVAPVGIADPGLPKYPAQGPGDRRTDVRAEAR